MDWILVIGIGIIIAVFATVIVFLIKGIKRGFLQTVIRFGVIVGSFFISLFSAKPLLWLFDRVYKFSLTFFDRFMNAFTKIPLMNEILKNQLDFDAQVATFESESVVMSPWLKQFLIKIFNNTKLYYGEKTTLATVGANALSYILMTVLIMLSVFFTLTIVVDMLFTKLDKIKSTGKAISKLGGAFFGILSSAVYIFISIALVSIMPIGTDDTTILDAVQKSVVMQKPFEITQSITMNYYSTNIDWSGQNKGFTKIEDVYLTTYEDPKAEEQERYVVTISFSLSNDMTETIYDKSTNTTLPVNNYKYIFANDKFWIFEIKTIDGEEQTIFVMSTKLNKKNKSIDYQRQIDNGDETFTNYHAILKQ